jgi:hypothetical protein
MSISQKETETAIRPEPRSTIPQSQVPRIRTWLKYGMKVQQVAQLIGVDASEIERVLRSG